MTLMPSGSAGARPSLDDLIQLLAQSGGGGAPSPYGGSGQPAGLFGSGYRAFMARQTPSQIPLTGFVGAAQGDGSQNPPAGPAPNAPLASAGDVDWAPAVRAMSPAAGGVGGSPVKLAYNDAVCPTCHTSASPPSPPPTLPPLKIPDSWRQLPPLPDPMWPAGLPPPLSGLVTAGQIADMLSGPQVSAYSRSKDPPVPPGSGERPDEWSKIPRCNEQFRQDREICRSLPDPRQREFCWRHQNQRLANCNEGKLDFPPLLGW